MTSTTCSETFGHKISHKITQTNTKVQNANPIFSTNFQSLALTQNLDRATSLWCRCFVALEARGATPFQPCTCRTAIAVLSRTKTRKMWSVWCYSTDLNWITCFNNQTLENIVRFKNLWLFLRRWELTGLFGSLQDTTSVIVLGGTQVIFQALLNLEWTMLACV